MIYCLIYVSSATHLLSAEVIETLISQSKPRNQSLGITGLLLYLNGSTIHVMDGPEENIKREFAIIRADVRHHQVTVLFQGYVEAGLFTDWQLNYKSGPVQCLRQIEQLSASWKLQIPTNPVSLILRSFYQNNYRN